MALVVTLILLSVITFLAVTFLVVSRRGAEQVATLTDQTKARQSAEDGAHKAMGSLLARMLANNNGFDFSLMVSTNWINPNGFAATNGNSITNVSYAYGNGLPLSGSRDQLQMLNNLFVLPRAPVFVQNPTNRLLQEFRYYLDLNRNGTNEPNGLVPEFDNLGRPIPNPTNALLVLSNFHVGDPEWIGVLDHPDQRHSSSNYFIGRYAYIILPAGNALDLNFIGNEAKLRGTGQEGYLRNEGFGGWEINLAGLLHALNPHIWSYQGYNTNLIMSSTGSAFDDANSLLQYRYNGDYRNLGKFSLLYQGYPSALPNFNADGIDGYCSGPLMTSLFSLPPDNDTSKSDRFPWVGGPNANQFYFTSRDLFTLSSNMGNFPFDLHNAGVANPSTFDRYTFYRMLEQLGTDSERETGKLNLNYNNIGYTTNSGFVSLSSTNFVPWTPVQFFTNAANKLLRSHPDLAGLTITNIRIWPNSEYTPAVHRILQLAANIYDATVYKGAISNNNLDYPSVFRPTFRTVVINGETNVFLNDYVEVGTNGDYNAIPLSLPEDLATIAANPANVTNIYGVPWIIGARRGFPNLNEVAVQSITEISRKLQIVKQSTSSPRSTWHTNVQYTLGASNLVAVEVWNSYSSNSRPVDIIVSDNLNMTLTNATGVVLTTNTVLPGLRNNYVIAGFTSSFSSNSFVVPVFTNVPFLPSIIYRQNGTLTKSTTFDTTTGFPQPELGFDVTNRLRFILLDHATGRVLDYVHFNGMDHHRHLTQELMETNNLDFLGGPGGVWDTNRMGASLNTNVPVKGMVNQVDVSMHVPPYSEPGYPRGVTSNDWTSGNATGTSFSSLQAAVDAFTKFMNNGDNTNLSMQVPYTPTRTVSRYYSWQANDPLVHYTLSDLSSQGDLAVPDVGITNYLDDSGIAATNQIAPNIGHINNRYLPWAAGQRPGGTGAANPNPPPNDSQFLTNMALKDPLIYGSDDWQFPTNKFPTVGWLGRVHRGTPWQTVYMKPDGVGKNDDWKAWTGDGDNSDSSFMAPTNDWGIFDLFTTAPNDNATRGQLSINQTNFAAWAAVLDGVIVNANDPAYTPIVITPVTVAGLNPLDPNDTVDPTNYVWQIVNDINFTRTNANAPITVFTRLGDILAARKLTIDSPFLNKASPETLNDAVIERLPQQILSLLKVGKPRFVIYSYGQALKPANNSIFSGSVLPALNPFKGTCTNYQVTAEVLTRTVVRLDSVNGLNDFDPFTALNPTRNPIMPDVSNKRRQNPPDPNKLIPRMVIESFAILPAD